MRSEPAGVLLAALTLVACTGESAPDRAAPSPTVAPGPLTPSEPTPTRTATAPPSLPDSCADLVSVVDVGAALGRAPLGRTTYLFAGPLPESGRTGRVTCGYGVRGGRAPLVEVSLIGYRDAAVAAERVALTVAGAQEDGDRVSRQRVGGYDGALLADRQDTSLVLAADRRTLVVTLRRGAVPPTAERSALGEIAVAVLDRLATAAPA